MHNKHDVNAKLNTCLSKFLKWQPWKLRNSKYCIKILTRKYYQNSLEVWKFYVFKDCFSKKVNKYIFKNCIYFMKIQKKMTFWIFLRERIHVNACIIKSYQNTMNDFSKHQFVLTAWL